MLGKHNLNLNCLFKYTTEYTKYKCKVNIYWKVPVMRYCIEFKELILMDLY